MSRLREFAENLKNIETDKQAESAVRHMVKNVVDDCPTYILIQLGQCIADCWKSHDRDVAERN